MNTGLAVIILLSLAVLAIAQTTKEPAVEKRQDRPEWKEAEDVYVVVDETNAVKFGLPIGTRLKLDEKTERYIPPELSNNFTADQRIMLTWTNKRTRDIYCKVGPGDLQDSRYAYSYYWHTWCRESDGRDLCCGKTHYCKCRRFGIDCRCLSFQAADPS